MLASLNIRNFKNLKELRINSLGFVNLFTGKNNTGKSTILEALSLYASKGDFTFLFQLLNDRGENYGQSSSMNTRPDNNKNIAATNIKALSSLFSDRHVGFTINDSFAIGAIENTLSGEQQSKENFISLRFVKYFDEEVSEVDKNQNSAIRRRRLIVENDEDEKSVIDYNVGFEIRSGGGSSILPLDRERPYRNSFRSSADAENFQFIRTRNIDREINGKLWDNITLTEKESFVIDALKIIEPNVERIAFIEESIRERTAVIKLSNSNNVLPLKSMGDGINRVLTIILALVNSDNGFLLLDEFENGLHYSVQEKLWEIIFVLAQRLNVQVFATTHSEDCISGFQKILNNANTPLDGKLIRLDFKNGTVKQVEFSANELKVADEQDIETR